ncbi:MAG: hypothetical protein MJ070_00355 [Lachnospiraceae bacterium]|nr:hypothetical protein [Lachnospiraceae bacterium]
MKKRVSALLLLALLTGTVACSALAEPSSDTTPATEGTGTPEPQPVSSADAETAPAESEDPYYFRDKVSETVLRNYLSRAVTVSSENGEMNPNNTAMYEFILHTGAKYIARANTEWSPSASNAESRPVQKAFIDKVHEKDPDVVFEACIFECISKKVNDIPIPACVFEAFGKTPEERNFSFDKMKFRDGRFKDQWGTDTTVPDVTQEETQMFFYCRACEFIDAGFEGFHMGQVELMGQLDTKHQSYTKLLTMIRAYAKEHARRGFVFFNAHTPGIMGSDGVLLLDFHGYPSPLVANRSEGAHRPTEDFPQGVEFRRGATYSIIGKSLGGMTYSGWECDSLPYLIELDNNGVDMAHLNEPTSMLWGMDQITWFANQPASYRRSFLRYALEWIGSQPDGCG